METVSEMFKPEFIDELVASALQEAWHNFNEATAVFSLDPIEDKIICYKHKEAIELLINWFGTPDQINTFYKNKS